jgi:uncharacterized protein (TIGR03083 family)
MTDAQTDPIAALRASHERLRSIASPLSPDGVRQRAYPTEWSIAQVLSHLGSGAQINGLVLDAGLAGTPGPERQTFQQIWDTWNAKEPAAQVADGLAADADLTARIEAARGTDARFTTWAGELNLSQFAATRLFEHALHTWDVAVVLDPAATVSADAVAIILPGLSRLVGFAAKPAGDLGRIHVVTTDPDDELALTLGPTSTLEPWSSSDAGDTAEVRLPAEAFVRLVYGRLDPDHTPTVHTDGVALDDLRTAFPGF